MYFLYDEKMVKFFSSHRGYLMSICIDKVDNTERVLNGILCLSAKNVPMISEGDVENPELKQINVNKIKWIMLRGIKHYPKGGTSNEDNSRND